jgi:hypothetical protein
MLKINISLRSLVLALFEALAVVICTGSTVYAAGKGGRALGKASAVKPKTAKTPIAKRSATKPAPKMDHNKQPKRHEEMKRHEERERRKEHKRHEERKQRKEKADKDNGGSGDGQGVMDDDSDDDSDDAE